jgi:hypothetical protein
VRIASRSPPVAQRGPGEQPRLSGYPSRQVPTQPIARTPGIRGHGVRPGCAGPGPSHLRARPRGNSSAPVERGHSVRHRSLGAGSPRPFTPPRSDQRPPPRRGCEGSERWASAPHDPEDLDAGRASPKAPTPHPMNTVTTSRSTREASGRPPRARSAQAGLPPSPSALPPSDRGLGPGSAHAKRRRKPRCAGSNTPGTVEIRRTD